MYILNFKEKQLKSICRRGRFLKNTALEEHTDLEIQKGWYSLCPPRKPRYWRTPGR